MGQQVFVTGAGFCVDVGECVGYREVVRYPLVSDLLTTCFGVSELPSGRSIEDLFQDAIDARNHAPLERLSFLIQRADYYLTPFLVPGGEYESNPYRTFLDDFAEAPLLTFNYDSLLEILLLRLGKWRPEDGFGVDVAAEIDPRLIRPPDIPASSSRQILHLHGTFCVYPSTFFIEERPGREFDLIRPREKPVFRFDPDTLGHRFFPFQRIPPDQGYQLALERIIAPIPNKATGLRGEFTVEMHKRAVSILGSADTVAWIGYSFNSNDQQSFLHLLRAAPSSRHVIVDPNAVEIATRLAAQFPALDLRPVSYGFAHWVREAYPGVYSD